MKVVLHRVIGRLVASRGRRTTPLERRRIVSMIDAGSDYASVQSAFGISAAHIDQVLRLHSD